MTFLRRLKIITIALLIAVPTLFAVLKCSICPEESHHPHFIEDWAISHHESDNNAVIPWYEDIDSSGKTKPANKTTVIIEKNEMDRDGNQTQTFNTRFSVDQKFFDAFVSSIENSPFGKNIRRKMMRYLLRSKLTRSYYPLRRDGADAGSRMTRHGTLKVLIHGFTHMLNEPPEGRISHSRWFELADEYVASRIPDLNVIIVDWTELSSYPVRYYPEAVDSSRFAGKDIAEFIIKLRNRGIVTFDKVHIIGFSLGCHVAGVAGHVIWQSTGLKVGRITGLDPAGPLFVQGDRLIDDSGRVLEKSDADFVDIIHCNMGDVLDARYGSPVQAGHADFYPNGGIIQPDCNPINNVYPGCSHHECPKFYIEGVNRKRLHACHCDSWDRYNWGLCNCQDDTGVEMGEHLDIKKASGKYYLRV